MKRKNRDDLIAMTILILGALFLLAVMFTWEYCNPVNPAAFEVEEEYDPQYELPRQIEC